MRAKISLMLIINLSMLKVSYSQVHTLTKEIRGDSLSMKYHNMLLTKFLLKDLKTSDDDFNFRFSDYGSLVDIRKKDSLVSGEIINYRFWQNRRGHKKDTIFQSVNMSPKQAKYLYNYIVSTDIQTLPSDKDIDGWKRGMDGVTYIIEQADKSHYSLRSYWTPSSQDSLREALIVQSLVDTLYDKLSLKALTDKFVSSLPHKGCYTSGGMISTCYVLNSLEVGYLGSLKFPTGYKLAYSAGYLGNFRTNASISLQHQIDVGERSDLSFNIAKWKLFMKKANSDFVLFNYRRRDLNLSIDETQDKNYKLFYGINFKPISLGLGGDYLKGNETKVGGLVYANKWFGRPKVNINVTSSVFKHQFDNKTEVSKTFNFNQRFVLNSLSVGLSYERFRGFENTGVGVSVSL